MAIDVGKIYNLMNEHYQSAGKSIEDNSRVLAVCLYGSQNYGLDTAGSDVDTKTFVIPSIHDLVNRKDISRQIVGDHEGGLNDLKDLSNMSTNFLKQNINYLEILFTPYYIVKSSYSDLFDELRGNRNLIAGCDKKRMLHAAMGMGYMKYHALQKPFESKREILAKYGYDPKQLASLLRLHYFLKTYLKTENFHESITADSIFRESVILPVKSGSLSEDEAVKAATACIDAMQDLIEIADNRYSNEPTLIEEAKEYLDDWNIRVIKKYLKEIF